MASGIPPKRKGEKAPETDAQPTYRMSMLPLGTYANPDGTESLGFALPGMLHEPLMAAERLFGTPSNPGTFTQGPDVPGNADDMRTLLLSMYGGNAMNPLAHVPEGGLGANTLKYLKRSETEITPETAALMASPDRVRVQPDYRSERRIAGDPTHGPGDSLTPAGFDFWSGARPRAVDNYHEYAGGFHNPDGLENTIRNQINEINDFERLGHLTPEQAKINRDHLNSLFDHVTGDDFDGTLFSDTGKPSLMGSAVAGAEANTPVRAFHSTNADFDKFDPAFTNEVGFHFGDKGTANNRAYIRANGNPFSYMKYRNIPVEMDVQNPAALSRDVTPNYSGLPLAKQLVSDGIAPKSLLDDLAGKPQPEQNATVRNWLVDNGYDAVKYPNAFEGGGKPSYMALGTGNVKHAKTGATLYSGGPSFPGSLAADQDTEIQNTNGDGTMMPPILQSGYGRMNPASAPQAGLLSGVPGVAVGNPTPNAPQMTLPAGLLSGMAQPGGAPQTAPAATPAPAAGNSIMQGLLQGDKDAIAAMPNMPDFQFQAPQRAPIDLSRLAAIAQARQLGVRA